MLLKRYANLAIIVSLVFNATISAHAQQAGDILSWATKLQQQVNAANTAYRHKDNVVEWGNDGQPAQCYADCSGFIDALLSKTFSWSAADFTAMFGHKRMYAWHYFQAITTGNHFLQVKDIKQVQPGDLIALQYANRDEHEDNTGHVMLVVAKPRAHQATKVFIPNTDQYEVEVIDCSRSPHGKTDTRWADGNEYGGLGRGPLRLYADASGNIVAYSWSPGNPKEDFNPLENPVVVGRLLLNR